MLRVFTLLLLVVASGWGDHLLPAKFTLLQPRGIRIAIDHMEGYTLYAVHYSVNNPVPGVAPGDWNFDIIAPTGDEWVHENRDVDVSIGDTINYWHLVIWNGEGHQLLDQSWTAQEATTTTTSTTTTATTTTTTPFTGSTPSPAPTTTTVSPTGPPGTAPPECDTYPCLVLEDEFDKLDLDFWQPEITAGGGGNWEFQYYTNNRSNSYTRDGVLYIKPTLTSETFDEGHLTSGVLELWGASPPNLCTGNAWYGCLRQGTPENVINPIQSARLRSVHSFAIKYGKVEVEAKMPQGDWIWPAIWMLPRHAFYGEWPASGEIDIVESRGNRDLRNSQGQHMGCNKMGATLHWGPFFSHNRYDRTNVEREADFGDSFHKYGVEWDEDELKFFLDDEEIFNVDPGEGGFWEFGGLDQELPADRNPWIHGDKMAPFDKEFYLVMNVAVGGTNGFFGDDWTNAGYQKPWNNESPTGPRDFWNARNLWYPTWNSDTNNGEDAAMQVRSVRVWKMKE